MASARERRIEVLRRKHASLEERIGSLMNQRVEVEDELARLLEQGQTTVNLRGVRGMSQRTEPETDE